MKKTSTKITRKFKSRNLLLLLSSMLVACQPTTYPDLETGKQLYDYHCLECHRSNGAGMMIKGVSQNRMKEIDFTGLHTQIKEGKGMMTSFSEMPDEQIVKIANFLANELEASK